MTKLTVRVKTTRLNWLSHSYLILLEKVPGMQGQSYNILYIDTAG